MPHPARLLSAGVASLLLIAAVPAYADETASPATPTTSDQATPPGSASPSETADHPGAPGNNGTVKIADYTDLDEQRPESKLNHSTANVHGTCGSFSGRCSSRSV